jgi:phospholipid transport system transporter-binding protein
MSAPQVASHDPRAGVFRLLSASPGKLQAQGPLTFASARGACALGEQTLAQAAGADLEIDCAGVTASDSAGLAVLLEWLGALRRAGRSLRYTQLPQGLASLARISEVDQLLERGV